MFRNSVAIDGVLRYHNARQVVCAIVLAVFGAFAIGLTPKQVNADERSDTHKTRIADKASQASASAGERMTQMPLVLPLVLEGREFSSTIVLVNGSDLSTYADVYLTGLDGREIRRQRVDFTPHSQRRLDISTLVQATGLSITAGRVSIMQSPDLEGMAIAAQLSLTYSGSSKLVYIDEETAMPSSDGSQTLRAVSDTSDGSPLLAVTSLSEIPQTVSIECLRERGKSIRHSVDIGPGQTQLTLACSHAAHALDGMFTEGEGPHGPMGISLSSSAVPGSFAAFGISPHKRGNERYFSAINFSDPKLLNSTNTIFTGVPVGSLSLLPEGQYVPQVAVANFSSRATRVRVKYAQTKTGAPLVEEARNLLIEPGASASFKLDGLSEDGSLNTSLIVESDGAPGDVMTKVVSNSESALHLVEVLGKDEKAPENGGSHPWSLEQGNESTLILFNPSAETHDFNVLISSEGVVWQKQYQLESMRTEQINIRKLISDKIQDDSAAVLPSDGQNGLVEWYSSTNGKGRLLESNKVSLMARNFSCTGYYCLCHVSFSPGTTLFTATTTVGFGSMSGHICQSSVPGPCCNSGTSVTTTSAATYSWSSGNTSVIQISGSSTGPSVNTFGPASGSTSVNGSMTYNGCSVPVSSTGDVCDFYIAPGGGITATYCDDINENTQNFNVSLTSGSPSSCRVYSGGSTCSVASTGNVSIDYPNSYMYVDSLQSYCHVLYWASGNPPPPYTGQQPGTYSLTMDIKFYQNDSGVSHDAAGEVTCR